MTVKELIIALLAEPMDAEVKLCYPKKYTDELGNSLSGILFDIDYVNHWNEMAMINFTDYRDKENKE